MNALFEPLALGDLVIPNRVVMSPMTRMRADDGLVPGAILATYYAQRASAGLIITEGSPVSPQGLGYRDTPGIWSDEQVKGWRLVTDAVHEAGGTIFLQLWHVGRISDPHFLGGEPPVAPSPVRAAGTVSMLRPQREFPVPRELTVDEIAAIVDDFHRGAFNAKKAGFDGVELHAANGYLIDQFLQDSTNLRSDQYGGSVENRARFLFEIVDRVSAVWGPGRVGVHLRPRGDEHDMGDSDPRSLFGYVAEQLGRRNLAFLFVREYEADDSLLPIMRELFDGAVIANENFTPASAEAIVAANRAEAVAFGRHFIANPDLVERIKLGAALTPVVTETIYADGALGYTDYPRLDELTEVTSS